MCVCVCVCVSKFVRKHVCMFVGGWVVERTHMYTRTHTQTQTQTHTCNDLIIRSARHSGERSLSVLKNGCSRCSGNSRGAGGGRGGVDSGGVGGDAVAFFYSLWQMEINRRQLSFLLPLPLKSQV